MSHSKIYSTLPRGYIAKSSVRVLAAGSLLFAGYELVTLDEKFYGKFVMPVAHKFLEAEKAHKLAVRMAKYGLLTSSSMTRREYAELECNIFGKHFKNPIGLAAGFDKDAEAIVELSRSGLGFIEVGSVTPQPQPGNAKPRLFRIPKYQAVINRYGFNSKGIAVVSQRVESAYPSCATPLGVNLGKNKESVKAEDDYALGAIAFAHHADYLVINVSSPNTPGLRQLQSRRELLKVLRAVDTALEQSADCPRKDDGKGRKRPALLLKISPDLSQLDMGEIAAISLDPTNGVDGLIVSNTTTSRPAALAEAESGGLSGAPLKDRSTECIAQMYRLTHGAIPIIGCGGVANGRDAYEKIRAGASLVQFYTALVYQGFPVVGKLKRELAECLRADNYTSVKNAVGSAIILDGRREARRE